MKWLVLEVLERAGQAVADWARETRWRLARREWEESADAEWVDRDAFGFVWGGES